MITEVLIEGQRLDLFQDESIELNRSVQDIKDISKIYTDFTQSFTVPASKNNNKIFKHFERPEIDNGYDTRTKKDATILINSLDFLKGRVRLEKVATKNNKPSDYTITFFGNLVSLKDVVGEDTLKDLEWLDQFDHDYTYNNVSSGLQSALNFTIDGNSEPVIKYPLLSPVRRFIYNTDNTDQTDTDTVANIAYNDSAQVNGIRWDELKPSISLKWILRAIQEKYNLQFNNGFFSKKEFTELQLWLSNDKGKMKAGGKSLIPLPDGTHVSNNLFNGWVEGVEANSPTYPTEYDYKIEIIPQDTEAEYTILVEDLGEPLKQKTGVKGTAQVTGVVRETNPGTFRDFALGFFIKSEYALTYDVNFTINEYEWYDYENGTSGYQKNTYTSSLTSQVINTQVNIRQQLPELTIEKFLSGLFKMFNLTVIPNGDILEVESLEQWYLNGKIRNISEYVDTTEVPVEKGTILRQIDLKFEKGESFLLDEFKDNFGRSYGDLNLILRDALGNRLDGETLTIDLPFEQMIYERLTNIEDSVLSKVQYGYVVDKDEKPYNLKPHIFYSVRQPLGLAEGIAIKDQAGQAYVVYNYNRPSHVGELTLSKFATVFNADYDEYTGDAITSNLLTNYYLDYLTDIFSSKRRVFSFKAKLTANLIRDIKLNDRLVINGRRYIINNMSINLITREADLELINDIYRGETQDSLTNKMILSSYFAEFNSPASSGSFTYTTNEEVNYLKTLSVEDLGNGTDWVTPTQNGNTILYDIAENTTGADRYAAIKLTGRNLNDTYFKIQQNA
jgi:hypothetical protein